MVRPPLWYDRSSPRTKSVPDTYAQLLRLSFTGFVIGSRIGRRFAPGIGGGWHSNVPDKLVRLTVPECPTCGPLSLVRLETKVCGETVVVTWCCARCSREWAVLSVDAERR